VLEEGVPGARVIIADCPSERYVPSLIRSKALQQPHHGGDTTVVHLTPAEVGCTEWFYQMAFLEAVGHATSAVRVKSKPTVIRSHADNTDGLGMHLMEAPKVAYTACLNMSSCLMSVSG
jgi:hypothetical protein